MLDTALKAQLKTYFERIIQPVEMVASLDTEAKSREMRDLLQDIAELSGMISLRLDGDGNRKPSLAIHRTGTDVGVCFAGLPMGHEFNSLILALLQVGGHPPKEAPGIIDQIIGLEGDFHFETYFSLSCQNCPDVVQALNLMAALNPRVKHTAIDGALFQQEVKTREIMAVPSVFLNGKPFDQGRINLEQILTKLDSNASLRTLETIQGKDAFDVLVIGGGPGGAAASVYAARKGIRTGLVADRFGGQLLDTLGIENLIAVQHTVGPALTAALERNVRDYGVDLMSLQTVAGLVPSESPGGMAAVRLANGASLKARTVILAPGARWRQMSVPGESEYRNKGVAYCPHCDGPLFKGKRVAVIGGGNSGVEAAIDLAGIVAHVTLLEFDSRLRADAVLQAKLRSLPNVSVLTSVQTTEVIGDGARVTGLSYKDRATEVHHVIELDGIFVQIGLVPNTEWLKGVLALNTRGEIEVDAGGQTSIRGVFAAGDATTAPFKQIVVAMGDGAKAALSAFDHLIRSVPIDLAEAA